jgi:5'-deoxynucleotidase YfbR-like HD superfamily hydrolase
MSEDVFAELDSRLSVVTRWVVVNTIKDQSVAEHCFNVERIALRIAMQWFRISRVETLYFISQVALHHDDDESITGDIPGPSKHILSEKYLDSRADLWYNRAGLEHDIVKLADKMEAFWFLTMESKLGNKYIAEYRAELEHKVLQFAIKFGPEVEDHVAAWVTRVENIKGKTHGWTT